MYEICVDSACYRTVVVVVVVRDKEVITQSRCHQTTRSCFLSVYRNLVIVYQVYCDTV